MSMVERVRDGYKGCLLGLAIGDALGSRLEGKSPEAVRRTSLGMEDFLDELWQWSQGRWTDDTKMALALAESMVETEGFKPEKAAEKYLEWYESGDLRGIGRVTRLAMQNLKEGKTWDLSGIEADWAAGNGTAMRAAPIGLFAVGNIGVLMESAKEDAVITHNNHEATNGSRAVAFGVSLLVRGVVEPGKLIPSVIDILDPCDVLIRLEIAQKLYEQNAEPADALDDIGTGGYVADTVAGSFFCLLNSPQSYERTVYNAILGGNDTDTTAAIAGALSGAFLGITGLPARWRASVEASEYIESVASRLYELAAGE